MVVVARWSGMNTSYNRFLELVAWWFSAVFILFSFLCDGSLVLVYLSSDVMSFSNGIVIALFVLLWSVHVEIGLTGSP